MSPFCLSPSMCVVLTKPRTTKASTKGGWSAECINETSGARKSSSKAGVDWVAELINKAANVSSTKTRAEDVTKLINLKAASSSCTSSNCKTTTKDTSNCKTSVKDNSWSLTTWSNDDSTIRNNISEFWGLTTWSNDDSAIREIGRVEEVFRFRFNTISRVV